MTQGYGPDDPNQPGYTPPPQPPPPPAYGGPYGPPQWGQPPYGQPPYGQPPYGPPQWGQPAYPQDRPGYYKGRQLANWGQRFVAYLIDWVIVVVPLFVAGSILRPITGTGRYVGGGAAALAVLLDLAAFGVWLYNRAFLAGRTGQSWGKQVMRTRLVDMSEGQPIGAGKAFLRDLAHILDSLACYIGWLFPLWDARRQTFADKIVQTVVLAES